MTTYNPIRTRRPNNYKQVGETLEGYVYSTAEKLGLDIRTLVINPGVRYLECIQVEFDFYKIPKMRFGIEARVDDFDADGNPWLADPKKDIYQFINIFSNYYTLMQYPIKKEFSLNTALTSSEIRFSVDAHVVDEICEYVDNCRKMNFTDDLKKKIKTLYHTNFFSCDLFDAHKRRDQNIKSTLFYLYTEKIPKAILNSDKDIISVAVITRKNPKDFPKWEVGYLVYKNGKGETKISNTTFLSAEDISKLSGLSAFAKFIKNIEDFNLQNVLTSFYIGNIPVINLEADIKAYHKLSQLKKIYRDGFISNPNLQNNGKIYKEYIKPEDFKLARKHLINLMR